MSSAGTGAVRARVAPQSDRVANRACLACGRAPESAPLELFHGASLFACSGCDLQYWYPAKMASAESYETAYQSRDRTAMPLEPGHRFFLGDSRAPKRGRLIDLGCGVGNFLAAARDAGFDVAGIELNQNAVRFAQDYYGLRAVFAARPEDFRAEHPGERFDVVTFFEVLEHQDDPQAFLNSARELLADGGFFALSVPNRNRWQKGAETLDYPPNHLTRWSPRALENFLVRNGFEILSLREEPLGVRRAAQVMSMGFRTGLMKRVTGAPPLAMADIIEMKPTEMQRVMTEMERNPRQRLAARLARWKNSAMVPAAALLLPYLRLRGHSGLYLYCLARLRREAAG